MKLKLYQNEKHKLFPLYPHTLSVNHPQEHISRLGGFDFNQIFIISEGSGVLRFSGETYILEKGDMFFLPAYLPHEYSGTDDFRTYFMGFCGSEKLLEYFGADGGAVYKGRASSQLYAAFGDFYNIFSRADEPLLCSRAFSLAVMFFSRAVGTGASPLEKICGYMEENFSKAITLEDILSVYPYSKSKLCRDFKNEYGMTVFERLTEIRLEHSFFMLGNNPEMKVKTIAEKCGYNDESYFCRMFRRRYGKTPEAVRHEI